MGSTSHITGPGSPAGARASGLRHDGAGTTGEPLRPRARRAAPPGPPSELSCPSHIWPTQTVSGGVPGTQRSWTETRGPSSPLRPGWRWPAPLAGQGANFGLLVTAPGLLRLGRGSQSRRFDLQAGSWRGPGPGLEEQACREVRAQPARPRLVRVAGNGLHQRSRRPTPVTQAYQHVRVAPGSGCSPLEPGPPGRIDRPAGR
jgi:hypothetical protein